MNQTYHQKSLNGSVFDNFQLSNHEPKPKKSNYIYSSKSSFKQAVVSGINYPVQTNTIFNDYNNFPSLSKCYSSSKMPKSQNNIFYLSKSFNSLLKDDKDSASITHKGIIKHHHRDKSSSTMQSTDERKEISKLVAELKEKKELVLSLNKTIDNYVKDKAHYTKEITSLQYQLSDYKMENSRLKEEYHYLQASYDKLKNSAKTIDISELLGKTKFKGNKEEEKEEEDESNKFGEQSLSGICFTDKVKMEKTVNNNENNILPTLDFGSIAGKREPMNMAVMNMKIEKPMKNYHNTMPKHSSNSKIYNGNCNYVGQKIIFKKQIHKLEGNLVKNSNTNCFFNCKK